VAPPGDRPQGADAAAAPAASAAVPVAAPPAIPVTEDPGGGGIGPGWDVALAGVVILAATLVAGAWLVRSRSSAGTTAGEARGG
jgi:hypothetical protein